MEAPWVEKYRPENLADIQGNECIIARLKSMSNKENLTNIILTGPPGTGKTSSALCIANNILDNENKDNVLKINASDNRCIDVIRKTIMLFAAKEGIGTKRFQKNKKQEVDNAIKERRAAAKAHRTYIKLNDE